MCFEAQKEGCTSPWRTSPTISTPRNELDTCCDNCSRCVCRCTGGTRRNSTCEHGSCRLATSVASSGELETSRMHTLQWTGGRSGAKRRFAVQHSLAPSGPTCVVWSRAANLGGKVQHQRPIAQHHIKGQKIDSNLSGQRNTTTMTHSRQIYDDA